MKKLIQLPFWAIVAIFLLVKCSKETPETPPPPQPVAPTPTLTASNLTTSIDENPDNGASIGAIQATTNTGAITYSIVSQSNEGAISVNASSGQITVSDASLFDFETLMVVTAVIRVSAGDLTEDVTVSVTINDVNEVDVSSLTLWTGPLMSFSKENGAVHTQEENQDRINDDVWITRAGAGQIFNIRSESAANSSSSPAGTEWAQGTFDDLADLTFTTFRSACPNGKPKNAVGVPMVVHLIQEDVYIELTLTSWGQGKVGGFAYNRSTRP